MTDATVIEGRPETVIVPPSPERPTRRELAEGKIEKVLGERSELVPMGDLFGGLRFENMLQVAEAAKLMSTAGPMLPPWLQGNVGGCWGIILRATELGISPLTLAEWSYVVEKGGIQRVAYMSQFYHAITEAKAPLKTRLNHEFLGEGDEMKCRVWATFRGEDKERSITSRTLKELRPAKIESGATKGSPLWTRKPEIQMFYDTSRDWARVYCPDILGGVYALEEMEEQGWKEARDVTPTKLDPLRLRGPGGEGFKGSDKIASHVNETLNAARATPAASTGDKPKQPAKVVERKKR